MVQSMTAFAYYEGNADWGAAVWELRSVNHRYLEIAIRLPEGFIELEPLVRARLRTVLQRGKIDCHLRWQGNLPSNTTLCLDKARAQQLVAAEQQLRSLIGGDAGALRTIEVLSWPGVVQFTEVVDANKQEKQAQLLSWLDAVLAQLVQGRQREGESLKTVIAERLQAMAVEMAKIKVRLPALLTGQREKLLGRVVELQQQLDSGRLEQEVVLFAHKIDISEELDRLAVHINETKRILAAGGAIGRRLEFLCQELNREVNTIAAKSADSLITQATVELKVLIEQLREQIQNIE